MRHYLAYDAQGQFVGIHTYHCAATQLGGWPDDCRLEDPDCAHEVAIARRASLIGKHGIVNFVPLNCECSTTETRCDCASETFQNCRLVDGEIVEKKTAAFVLDGNPIPPTTMLNKAPGTALSLKLVAAGIADGKKAKVASRSNPMLMEQEGWLDLTFTNGETQAFVVRAPAQGLIGEIAVVGEDNKPLRLRVRGWA